jgi:hypothetical protein
MAVKTSMLFWVVTPCGLSVRYQRFRGIQVHKASQLRPTSTQILGTCSTSLYINNTVNGIWGVLVVTNRQVYCKPVWSNFLCKLLLRSVCIFSVFKTASVKHKCLKISIRKGTHNVGCPSTSHVDNQPPSRQALFYQTVDISKLPARYRRINFPHSDSQERRLICYPESTRFRSDDTWNP